MRALVASALITGTAFAAHNPDSKTLIYIDLDSHAAKAHTQLQLLKNMDVLGVNLKQHWAEVSVTAQELAQLKAHNLHVRKADNQIQNFSAASDGYLNPEQVIQALTTISTQHPTITRLFETGKTHQNRSIMALEVSAHVGNPDKPVLLFNAMHHAREVMSSEVVMHIAKVLTENYGTDPEVTNWLDNFRVIIVPQVNPDGNALVSNGQVMWRKNAYEIEGTIVGVDLNRNYPAYWNYCDGSSGNPQSDAYRGPFAASEPETQSMMNLVNTFKPVADISYHSYSELIIHPFGCNNVDNPSKDLFVSIAKTMNEMILNDENQPNSYVIGTAPELLYDADGSDLDWQWKEHGVLAYTIEVNSYSFHPEYNAWRDVTVERQEGGWKALFRRMQQSGFRAHIVTANPNQLRYSLNKVEGKQKIAFDTDSPNRTFSLRSTSGLLYQLTEKGQYELTFFDHNQSVKTMTVNVGDTLVDLGDIVL